MCSHALKCKTKKMYLQKVYRIKNGEKNMIKRIEVFVGSDNISKISRLRNNFVSHCIWPHFV